MKIETLNKDKIENDNKNIISTTERLNIWAKKAGYKDINEYNRNYYYKTGKGNSMDKNKNCSMFLGVHVAEKILPYIFKDVKRIPINNKGYDFICSNGHKIDVKSSCILHIPRWNFWTFNIEKNKIANYFLCIAFNNRKDLNVEHIWLISGNEYIKNSKNLNEYMKLSLGTSIFTIKKFKKYEITDKLDEINKTCDKFKKENTISNTEDYD